MNTTKNIALLCDYGLDDIIATLYLFENSHKFGKIDILSVAGNMPLEQTFINAKRIVTHTENLPKNIRIVDTASVEQKNEALYDIHGRDGMGDVLPAEFEEKVPVISYCEWLSQVDDSYTLVSLGPCTVTLDIIKNKGALPLIMMCGNINEPPNYNGYEFNHGLDAYSFAQCVKFPHICATLDTCHCNACDMNKTEIKAQGLLGKMLERYHQMSLDRKEEICSVYDLTAVVYLIHPERFETYRATDPFGNKITVLRYISDKPLI